MPKGRHPGSNRRGLPRGAVQQQRPQRRQRLDDENVVVVGADDDGSKSNDGNSKGDGDDHSKGNSKGSKSSSSEEDDAEEEQQDQVTKSDDEFNEDEELDEKAVGEEEEEEEEPADTAATLLSVDGLKCSLKWLPKLQLEFICPGCSITKPFENSMLSHIHGAKDRGGCIGYAIVFANYVTYKKKDWAKSGTKARDTTPANIPIFKSINRGKVFTKKERKAAPQKMITTLQDDNFVVPERFFEALSPEVDEFELMYELSTNTARKPLFSRLLSRYTKDKLKRYNQYVELQVEIE